MSHRKPPDRRQRRSTSDLALPASGMVDVPEPPRGLLKVSRDRWAAFWRSPVARAVDLDSDLYRLERWVRSADRLERLLRVVVDSPLVTGSQGQPRANPLWAVCESLTREIERAETEFGMTPMARLKLGVALGDAHRSLEDLAVDAMAVTDDDEDTDPRLVVLTPTEGDTR